MVVLNRFCDFYSETIREKGFPFWLANIFFQFGWGSTENTAKIQWDFRNNCNRVGIGSSKTFPLRANCHYYAWFVLLNLPPPFKQNWGFRKGLTLAWSTLAAKHRDRRRTLKQLWKGRDLFLNPRKGPCFIETWCNFSSTWSFTHDVGNLWSRIIMFYNEPINDLFVAFRSLFGGCNVLRLDFHGGWYLGYWVFLSSQFYFVSYAHVIFFGMILQGFTTRQLASETSDLYHM